jgi:hypothetical protein
VIRIFDERPNIFIKDEPILPSERLLHKDYDHNGSVAENKSLVLSFKMLGVKTNCLELASHG